MSARCPEWNLSKVPPTNPSECIVNQPVCEVLRTLEKGCAPGRNGDLHRNAQAPDPPRDVCWTVWLSRKSFRSLPVAVVRGPITIRPYVLLRRSQRSSGSFRSSTYGKSRSVVPWFILLTPAGAFVGTVLPVGRRFVRWTLHEPLV